MNRVCLVTDSFLFYFFESYCRILMLIRQLFLYFALDFVSRISVSLLRNRFLFKLHSINDILYSASLLLFYTFYKFIFKNSIDACRIATAVATCICGGRPAGPWPIGHHAELGHGQGPVRRGRLLVFRFLQVACASFWSRCIIFCARGPAHSSLPSLLLAPGHGSSSMLCSRCCCGVLSFACPIYVSRQAEKEKGEAFGKESRRPAAGR